MIANVRVAGNLRWKLVGRLEICYNYNFKVFGAFSRIFRQINFLGILLLTAYSLWHSKLVDKYIWVWYLAIHNKSIICRDRSFFKYWNFIFKTFLKNHVNNVSNHWDFVKEIKFEKILAASWFSGNAKSFIEQTQWNPAKFPWKVKRRFA